MTILAPVPTNRRGLRFVQLFAGLVLYGFSDGLLVRANLGLDPWDVFHQGLSRTVGLEIGTWSIIVGAFVLLLWIPLHQQPGVGTVCNIVIVGLVLNVTVNVIPAPKVLVRPFRGVGGRRGTERHRNGCVHRRRVGTWPARRADRRDRRSRGVAATRSHFVEVTVLIAGWLLGGTVGIGTLVYALLIGPITHVTIPAFRLSKKEH